MLPSNIELRKDIHGNIDDIVVKDPTLFRMERMSDTTWWIRVYTPKGDLVINCIMSDQPSFELD